MTKGEEFQRYGMPLVVPLSSGREAILGFVARGMPEWLTWVDREVRARSPYSPGNESWLFISTDEIEETLSAPTPDFALLGLISFHRSGYVRELAVRRLAQISGSQELTFLLLRLNDWVVPVSEAARTALQDRLTPEYARAFVRNLGLVADVGKQTRRDTQWFASVVNALLLRPDCDDALQAGLAAPNRLTRRLCFRLLREANDDRLPEVLPRLLADDDPALRQAAARTARISLPDDALRAVLPLMMGDPSVAVRREALSALVERFIELAPAALTAALLDRHPAPRETARYHLRQAGGFDAAAFYRQTLTEPIPPPMLEAAISGLGETGTAADLEQVLPFLSHSFGRVRRAAVRAFGRLDGDGQIEVLLAALKDARPRVSHEAREALRPRLGLVDAEVLWQTFRSAAPPHVRRDALALLAALPKWEAVPFLAQATADPDPALRERASEYLRTWLSGYNASFMRPTRRQVARLEEALRLNPEAALEELLRSLKEAV